MRWLIQGFGHLLAPAARRFHQALDTPQVAQRTVQQTICDRLIASEYGRHLKIHSITDWQKIPIVEYDDIKPWITTNFATHVADSLLVKPPHSSLLTSEPILFYEQTSGSCGPVKWIPYTRSLRRSFNQMFCVWAHDLIQNGPGFLTGKVYFCISPQLSPPGSEQFAGGIQDDSEYLDGWLRWLLRPFWVAPALQGLRDPELFKRQLCLALLQEERLETISIWSPSFLTVLLNYVQANQPLFLSELHDRISTKRLQFLAEAKIPWSNLWPELKLISCWDSAQAADRAVGLRSQFPNALVQGKGLLATEAPMTIPLIQAQGYVPVLDEVFFEFEDAAGDLCLLHELQVGQAYSILLSQKGGLYRYRIGDRVRVTHYYRNTPCLEFLGRHQTTSDLVGEKLHESFVQEVLQRLQLEGALFQSLVPVADPQARYLLLLDAARELPETIAQQLDQALFQSPQYRHARGLGQLAPPQVLVSRQIPDVLALYRSRSGSTWAGVKHPLLVTTPIQPDLLAELIHLDSQEQVNPERSHG